MGHARGMIDSSNMEDIQDIARECAAVGQTMLAACYREPAPDAEEAAAAITTFHEWMLAGKNQQGAVEGFPDIYTARLYVAGMFGNEHGDGDDDLFCNLSNYGTFAKEPEKFIACRNAIDAIQDTFSEAQPRMQETMESMLSETLNALEEAMPLIQQILHSPADEANSGI
jgi:hypothetical protein